MATPFHNDFDTRQRPLPDSEEIDAYEASQRPPLSTILVLLFLGALSATVWWCAAIAVWRAMGLSC